VDARTHGHGGSLVGGQGAGLGEPATVFPATGEHVTDRGGHARGRAGDEQGGARPRLPGGEAADDRTGDEGGDEAADPHGQAGDRVVELVVPGALLAGGRRVPALPPERRGHGADEAGDGEDGEVGTLHGGLLRAGDGSRTGRRDNGGERDQLTIQSITGTSQGWRRTWVRSGRRAWPGPNDASSSCTRRSKSSVAGG